MASSETLVRLPVFVTVAETKSFTLAARRLGISASGASKAVSQLERTLGLRLFDRTTRRVRLTDDGAAYYQRCRQILDDLEEAEAGLAKNRSIPMGNLHVSLQSGLGRLHIAPAIPAFAARHPNLTIEVGLNDRWVDLVGEGIDLAVRLGGPPDARLIERELSPTRGIICASPAYLRRFGEPLAPGDLARHNVYVFAGLAAPARLAFVRGAETVDVAVSGNLTSNNADALVELACAGRGACAVVSFVARRAVEEGALVPILADWRIPMAPAVSVVYPKSRHLSAKVRAFADFVADLFPRDGSWDGWDGSPDEHLLSVAAGREFRRA